ncbi:MAG: hypothetical protein KC800_19080 [Candidatus Eremiobacteraeota bacterium]|nr:hypothetical protein [Candidatus Eremiobacteraeota bacterium]
MERPDFIKIIISSLLFDLVLIFLAPLLGYAFLLVLLVLLYGIPLYVGVGGVKPALDYMSRTREGDVWSGLSHLICGSSLLFLLVVVVVEFLGDPNELTELHEILLWLYAMILFLRFSAAALVNLVVSIPCLIRCKGNDRLSAGAGMLCSWAGLAFGRDLFFSYAEGGPDYVMLAVFVLANFLYGLGCGGAVQWLIRQVSKPEES